MTIVKIGQTATSLTDRILTNKKVLNTLAKVSEHGTSFSAGTALAMSTIVRPLAISTTPDVEKENKQYAMANSIGSGLIKFGLVEAIALPIEYAVKRIDQNPEKYLNQETIKKLSEPAQKLSEARPYKLITQIIKLSTGFFTAIPKSMLTIALIPILMDKIFSKKEKPRTATTPNIDIHKKIKNRNVNFTGISENLSKTIGKIIDNKPIQNFAKRFQNKDNDIAKHITAGTDLLLTGSFAYQTNKSKKIEENRKKVLIYNNWIATGITIAGGYLIDNIVKKSSSGFIEKFKQLNYKDPRLGKYIEGLNILRPTIIFAAIYYGFLPIFSTYMSERVDKFVQKHQNKNQ